MQRKILSILLAITVFAVSLPLGIFTASAEMDGNDYLVPYTTEGEQQENLIKLDVAADKLLNGIIDNAGLTDVQKALLIHDRIILNCEYTDDAAKSYAYDALLGGIANANGYAVAYKYLLEKVGIQSELETSEALNRVWNVVEIESKKYYADLPLDDPSYDVSGRVLHKSFLISSQTFYSNFTDILGSSIPDFDMTLTNTDFEDDFWTCSKTAVQVIGNDIYYIDSDNSKLMKLGEKTALAELSYNWPISESLAYMGNYSKLASDGYNLYYSDLKQIYKYDVTTGEITSAYTLGTEFGEYANIFGFIFKDCQFIFEATDDLNWNYDTKLEIQKSVSAPHYYGNSETAPWLNDENEHWNECLVCGSKDAVEEHSYDNNCDEICNVCGYERTALHNIIVVPAVEPTCTDFGWTELEYCSLCKKVFTASMSINALGHIETEAATSEHLKTAADCTNAATYYVSCSRCGENLSKTFEVGEPLGHIYEDTQVFPTCVAQGYTLHTCSRCNDTFIDGYLGVLGHDYSETVTPPDCTEQGYTTHICSRCDDTFIDNYTDALGHNYVDAVCTRCGEENPDVITRGTCGETVLWMFNNETGILTIFGTGEMNNYTTDNLPWYSFCSQIKSIVVEDGVTRIGEFAFFDCTALNSVEISDTVILISNYAFANCSALETLTIPDSVLIVGTAAFMNCGGLKSLSIGKSLQSIGTSAFKGCNGLESIAVSEENTIYHSNGNCLIKTAAKELILGCNTSVIPSDGSVTSIGSNAFADCTGITDVEIPDGVTLINGSAFSGCTGLTEIVIPDTTTSVGSSSFAGCAGLVSITIGNSVKTIGNEVFKGCSSLSAINIPASVTSIGSKAFADCGGLETITVSEENTLYKSIDNCLIETGSAVLIRGCKNSIIPTDGSVTVIGDYAFSSCGGLTTIEIPDSITAVGNNCFENCTDLISVVVSDSVTELGQGVFAGCTELDTVTLSGTLESIPAHAFEGCTGLASINIPKSVVLLGEEAFKDSGLIAIILPYSVTTIGLNVFSGCDLLTDVYYTGTQTQKSAMEINDGNDVLSTAQWHYLYSNCEHINTEVKDDSEPTCTDDGYSGDTYCLVCGEMIAEGTAIPATGHNYEAVVTAPTCEESGYTTHTCSNCKDTYTDSETDPIGHSYGEWTVKTPATCDTYGTEIRVCVNDSNHIDSRTIEPLGHTEAPPIVENFVSSTCTEKGHYDIVVYCLVCGDELRRETILLNELGHDLINHESKAPTCTEAGWEAYDTCSRCDYTTFTEIPDLGGHNVVIDPAVPATYDQTGISEGSHCERCGEILVERFVTEMLKESVSFTYEASGINGSDYTVNSGFVTLKVYMNVNSDIARIYGLNLSIKYNSHLTLVSADGCIFKQKLYTPVAIANQSHNVVLSQDMNFDDYKLLENGNYLFATLIFRVDKDFYSENAVFEIDTSECNIAREFANELIADYGTGAQIYVNMLGDSNDDGKIDTTDTMKLARWFAAADINDYEAVFDMNKDGYIDGDDFIFLRGAVVHDYSYLDI